MSYFEQGSMLSTWIGERSADLIEFEHMVKCNKNVLYQFRENNIEPEFKIKLTERFGRHVMMFLYRFFCHLQSIENLTQIFELLEVYDNIYMFRSSWSAISNYFNCSNTIDILIKISDFYKIHMFDEDINHYAMKYSSANGHYKLVEMLLESVDPCVDDNYSIKWASVNGHDRVVEVLLKDGRADPCVNDNWSIRCACFNGHYNVVKLLLDDGRAEPGTDEDCAVNWASYEGHYHIVDLLVNDKNQQ